MLVPSDLGHDDIEQGEELEALYLADALRKLRKTVYAFPEGECLNCEVQLEQHRQRFCDADCAADWTARMDTKGRQWSV